MSKLSESELRKRANAANKGGAPGNWSAESAPPAEPHQAESPAAPPPGVADWPDPLSSTPTRK